VGVRAVSTIPEYQVQPFAWIVKPKGVDLFAETVTKIERTDEAAGQFLLISQQDDQIKPGTIRLNMEEWPALRQAIDAAFDAVLADELHDFAPEAQP